MPVFDFDGQSYDVKDEFLDDFIREYPDAVSLQERRGQEYSVKASDYRSFTDEFDGHKEQEKDQTPQFNGFGDNPLGISKPVTEPVPAAGWKAPMEFQENIEDDGEMLSEEEKRKLTSQNASLLGKTQRTMEAYNQGVKDSTDYMNSPEAITKQVADGGVKFNEDTSTFDKTYLTPIGSHTTSKAEAEETARLFRNVSPTAGNRMRKAAERLEDVERRLAERGEELYRQHEESKPKGLIGTLMDAGKAMSGTVAGAAMMPENPEDWSEFQFDDEYQALRLQARKLKEEMVQLGNLQENERKGEHFWHDFFRNTWQKIDNVDAWDFGQGAMRDAATMLNISRKDKDSMSDAEKDAMYELYLHQNVMSDAADLGRGARWGDITGGSLSFMKDFLLTGGGFSGLSTKLPEKIGVKIATRAATGLAEDAAHSVGLKLAKEGIKSAILKGGKGAVKRLVAEQGVGGAAGLLATRALGVTAEELLIKAPLMATTIQGQTLASEIIDTRLGKVAYNPETGELRFAEDKTWGRAAWEKTADRVIENFSEMRGKHMPDLTDATKAFGLRGFTTFLLRNTREGAGTALSKMTNFMRAAGYNGILEEIFEEYDGQAWRTMLRLPDAYTETGRYLMDGTPERINNFMVGQFHGDIWGGMALSVGLTGSATLTATTVGRGLAMAPGAVRYLWFRQGMERASARAAEQFEPTEWEAMRSVIDATRNWNIPDLAESVMSDKDLSDGQREAVMDYMERVLNMRGYNLGELLSRRSGETRSAESDEADWSFTEGYGISTPQERRDASAHLLYRHQKAEEAGISNEVILAIDNDPAGAVETVRENRMGWTPEQQRAALDYIYASQVYNGMMQRVRDDIDTQVAASDAAIDNRTNRGTGTVQGATMTDGRQVYVISGNVAATEDGGAVNAAASDESVIVRDPVTGRMEQVSPRDIASLNTPMDPQQMKETAANAIRRQVAGQVAREIDGTLDFVPGQQLQFTDDNGEAHTYAVVSYDGGEYVRVTEDGKKETDLPVSIFQQQADDEAMQRVADFDAQNDEARAVAETEAEEAETEQRTAEYNDGDEITLLDSDGSRLEGQIVMRNEDGTYLVIHEKDAEGNDRSTLTEDELNTRVVGHNGAEVASDVETAQEIEAQTGQTAEITPQSPTALEQIPADDNGQPDYVNAPSADVAWDALVEQSEGDTEIAKAVADGMVAQARKALKAAEKAPMKNATTPAEMIAAQKAKKANVLAAQNAVRMWEDIASTTDRRMKAAEEAFSKVDESRKNNGSEGAPGAIAETKNNATEDVIESVRNNGYDVSEEKDMFGHPFIKAKNGTISFGNIGSETGLTEAPIRLSMGENRVGEDNKNHGYGLLHIEAGHGQQIRDNGFNSVEEFVETVASSYTDIREGGVIADNQTYLLELSDDKNNTLFIQLSRDGKYWNVNSAGIFKKKYSRNKPVVHTVPAVSSDTNTDAEGVNRGQSEGVTATSRNSPRTTMDKDSDSQRESNTQEEKVVENQIDKVPDVVDDTPEAARARGFRRVDGHRVDRQEAVPHLEGKEVTVKFSNKVLPKGHVAVIDASRLQPSHLQGQVNHVHFLDEAQPKDRADATSAMAAQRIARNIRPEEITSSVTAYTGAPSVNARGEVIQGNNRADALRYMWDSEKAQGERYRQYLMDHAAEFGLNADDIAAMEAPVLVNMFDVDDRDAIDLGQYVASDTESGGTERIKPKNAAQKMGDDMRLFAEQLLDSAGDDDMSFAQLLDRNAYDVLHWMNQQGYITPTQFASAFDTKGNITADAKNDLKAIMFQSIFKGGNRQLEEMFNRMPAKAQKAILATAYRDYASPSSESMINELQDSIRAFDALMNEQLFQDAKNWKDAANAVDAWSIQYIFDDVTGESYLPSDKFSNFALHLATMYKAETQRKIQGVFNEIYDLVQGAKEDNLFEEADKTPRTLAEAISETLNIEYNGQRNGNVLGSTSQTGTERQPGGKRDNQPGERAQSGTGSADDSGRTSGSRRPGGETQKNQVSEENQVRFLDPRTMTEQEKQHRGEMLRNAPVTEVGVNVITSTPEMSARKAAEKWWDENVSEPAFYDTEVGEVEINRNTVQSSLAHRYGQKKLDAISSLIEGFENAVYLGTMPDSRERGVVDHYFAYPISYNGETNYVFCRAMQDGNKNRLYVHEVFLAGNIKKGDTLQTAASKPHGGISLYRDILANVLDSEFSLHPTTQIEESVPLNDSNKPTSTDSQPALLGVNSSELDSSKETQDRHTTVEQSAETVEESQGTEQSSTQAPSSMNSPKSPKESQSSGSDGYLTETPSTEGPDLVPASESESSSGNKGSDSQSQNNASEGKSDDDKHKIVSTARYEELKRRMREKLGQLNMGIDPEMMAIGAEMAVYHIEGGARKFVDYAKAMIADIGDAVRPYLKSFYNAVRDMPEAADFADELTPYEEVRKFNVATIGENGEETKPSIFDTAEQISNEETVRMDEAGLETTVSEETESNGAYTIAPAQYTTKKGKVLDMFLVTSASEMGKEAYKTASTLARKMKGWYDAKAKGFMLRSEEDAKKFAEQTFSSPIGDTSTAEEIQGQRDATNTNPTEGQKAAGNYAKGHIKVDGYDITIENPKGSTRSGKDANGKEWSVRMNYDYGYIRRTKTVDGDHIDVYLSDNPASGNVYVVDQVNQRDGSFDEHKVMYGFPSMEAAREAYASQYEDGWKIGTITEVSREEFKKWIDSSFRKTKPFAEYKSMRDLDRELDEAVNNDRQRRIKENQKTFADRYGEQGPVEETPYKPGKYNQQSYASTEENQKPISGTYHDKEGIAVTTDGHILVADRTTYDRKQKGKMVGKNGDEIEAKFPDWRAVVPSTDNTNKGGVLAIAERLGGIKSRMDAAYDKYKKDGGAYSRRRWEESGEDYRTAFPTVAVRFSNGVVMLFKYATLKKFIDAALHLGINDISNGQTDNRAIKAEGKNGLVLAMPVLRPMSERSDGDTFIDLMESEPARHRATEHEGILDQAARIDGEQQRKRVEDAVMPFASDRLKFVVYGNRDELPYAQRAMIESGRRVWAWVQGSTVHIYAPSFRGVFGQKELQKTILHEVVQHIGMERLLGEEFDPMMRQIWHEDMTPEQRGESARYVWKNNWDTPAGRRRRAAALPGREDASWSELTYKEKMHVLMNEDMQSEAADEWLASRIEEEGVHEKAWFNKLADAVRVILRKMGVDISLSNSEIADMWRRSAELLKREHDAAAEDEENVSEDADGQTRFRFIGEKGAANLDAAEEATTRLDNLDVARKMEKANKDAKAIKYATGWERGADKKWRYEVPDGKINTEKPFKTNQTLDKVLSDDELFKAYPQLKKSMVFIEDTKDFSAGYFDPITKAIVLNKMYFRSGDFQFAPGMYDFGYKLADEADELLVFDTLVHEIQHVIQGIEGFAKGGNVKLGERISRQNDPLTDYQKNFVEDVQAYLDFEKNGYKGYTLPQFIQSMIRDDESRYGDNARDYILMTDEELRKEFESLNGKKKPLGAYETYQRFAGEVEARNVSRRVGMTAEERRNSLASETEDVAREDQIFLDNLFRTAVDEDGQPSIDTDTRFRADRQVERKGNLIAIHNINAESLGKALDLGGFPMPSIAITTPEIGHTEFGDISLLFGSDTINPSDRRNRVYTADAWTPTFPNIVPKINEKAREKISEKVYSLLRESGYANVYGLYLDESNMDDAIRRWGNFVDAYNDNTAMRIAFLNDKGIAFRPVMVDKKFGKYDSSVYERILKEIGNGDARYLASLNHDETMALESEVRDILRDHDKPSLDSYLERRQKEGKEPIKAIVNFFSHSEQLDFKDVDRIIKDTYLYAQNAGRKEFDKYATEKRIKNKFTQKLQGEFEQWLDNLGEGIIEKYGIRNDTDVYTYSGNRRSWNALHDDITLDNVIKAMLRQDEKGGSGFLGGSPFNAAQTKIGSMSDIRDFAKDHLATIDREAYEDAKGAIVDRLSAIAIPGIDNTTFSGAVDTKEIIVDAMARSTTAKGIYSYIHKWHKGMTMEIAEEIAKAGEDIRAMQTDYLEAKPARAVGFDEVRLAVVPKGTDAELVQRLEDKGIPVRTYNAKKEGDRAKVLNKGIDEENLRFRISPAQDKEYLEAVKSGDMATAQRMVNEAADAAGYNTDSSYQGTSAFNGAAPSSSAYYDTKEERLEALRNEEYEGDVSLGDLIDVPGSYITGGFEDFVALQGRRGGWMARESAYNIQKALREGKRTITMYRSVPKDVKENSFRNGDWITPSRAYAEDNAAIHDFKGRNIIEMEVPFDEVWWDGNDINEWGYDDGKGYAYRNTKNNRKSLDAVTYDDNGEVIPLSKRFNNRNADVRFRSEESERRRKRNESNNYIDEANAFITGKSKAEAKKIRLTWEQEHRDLARKIYDKVLKYDFDDVTLRQIDRYIDEYTPNNPYGRHISQRLPQKVERGLLGVDKTNAVDALFSRIGESAVEASGKSLAQRTREVTAVKNRLLEGWAKATGNWHTSIGDFTSNTEPIGHGKDSDVYLSDDGKSVIKVSRGKDEGRKFISDIDAVNLFNSIFYSTRYDILGYGEIGGKFVKFLRQPFITFAEDALVSEEDRVGFMRSLGFEPRRSENTVFSNGTIVAADIQKGNIVRDSEGKIQVIDADVKLHTKDIGGNYAYPSPAVDTENRLTVEEKSADRFRTSNLTPEEQAQVDAFEKEVADITKKAKADGTFLKAPNGKDSKLSERNWAVVRTSQFKKWFGDWENDPGNASKVVDMETGEPLLVHHGSRAGGFTVFDDTEGKMTAAPDGASFFSSDYGVARSYSGTYDDVKVRDIKDVDEDDEEYYDKGDPANYEVFLNIREPYEEDFHGANWDGSFYGGFGIQDADMEMHYFSTEEEMEDYIRDNNLDEEGDYEIYRNPDLGMDTNSVAREAIDMGADGAIIYNVYDDGGRGGADVANDYVTFSPEQIKSVDNYGLWGRKEEDIRFRSDIHSKLSDEEYVERLGMIGNLNPTDLSEATPMDKKEAEAFFESLKPGENIHDGRRATWPKNTVGKILRHQGFDSSLLISKIKEVYDNAVPIMDEPEIEKEGHKKHPNFVGYHHYVGKVSLNGKKYLVRLTTQELNTRKKDFIPNQLHSTFVSDVEIVNANESITSGNNPAIADDGIKSDAKLLTFFENARAAKGRIDSKKENLAEGHERFRVTSRFQDGLDSNDEIYDALTENAEWTNGPADVIASLEDFFGGELISASNGARHAIGEGKVPYGTTRRSAVNDGEYHHMEFRGKDGETFVREVPFFAKDELPESVRFRTDVSPSMEEAITIGMIKLADKHKDNLSLRESAVNAVSGSLRRAMNAQRRYDRSTVSDLVALSREMMQGGFLTDLNQVELARVLAAIKDGTGRDDLQAAADRILDVAVDSNLKTAMKGLEKLLKIRGSKVDAKGVEVQGRLDVSGQRMMEAFKKGITLTEDQLTERYNDALDRMSSDSSTVAEEARDEFAGLAFAMRYADNIRALEVEEDELRKDIKNTEKEHMDGTLSLSAEEYRQWKKSQKDAIRENRIDRAEQIQRLVTGLAQRLQGSIDAAKDFTEREKQRVEDIQHDANSDMFGRPSDEHHQESRWDKVLNSGIVRFFLRPLATFDQMLRQFGSSSVDGRGYLWNRFMGGYQKAADAEWNGMQEANAILDRKVSEVFGKGMRWSRLYAIERRLPTAEVTFLDGGVKKPHTLTQGNMLYIYMADKMADGRMKLRKMGISEEDVKAIKATLDPRFIELADWVQGEFLPSLRDKYNEVHKRMFGASMAAIDNYFPLRVLNNARVENIDVSQGVREPDKGSTVTGSVIKRRRNALALDILGADAFSVVVEHVQEMEHWAAFAEFNRDLNTLLSYKRFRNQVKNMTTVYGAGDTLWKNFNDTAMVVAGTYRGTGGSHENADALFLNLAKGVTEAKIAFRFYTALKQTLSFPALMVDANPVNLAKSMATPGESWKWAMENLPLFRKRWESRMAGNEKLMQTDMDWKFWQNEVVKALGRAGMSPNAFVDAVTISIGAKAIYDTKYARYIREGFSEEKADEKARQDASVIYNESQQSSEAAFLSPMQKDRSVFNTGLTVFRNSSMGYQRQLVDAVRNLSRIAFKDGYRDASMAFMTKQLVREGLSEEQAADAAESRYNRQITHDLARVAMFRWIAQFAWNLGSYLPYLLFGGDDDERKEMLDDAAMHALFGSIEGLSAGAQLSELGNNLVQHKKIGDFSFGELPITSDIQTTISHFGQNAWLGINDLVRIGVQAGVGVNPQTVTDWVVSVIDLSNGNMSTAREIGMFVLRVMSVPQSQLDKLYLDELEMPSKEELESLPVEERAKELAERYARYKFFRDSPLTYWFAPEDEKENVLGKKEKRFNTLSKERREKAEARQVTADFRGYWKEYYEVESRRRELAKKAEESGAMEYARQITELLDGYGYGRYAVMKKADDNLTDMLHDSFQTQSDRKRARLEGDALKVAKKAVEKMKAIDAANGHE